VGIGDGCGKHATHPCRSLTRAERLIGVESKENPDDSRLVLAVKPLYPCSEVCVRVGGVMSKSFTMGVGLRQGVCCRPVAKLNCAQKNCFKRKIKTKILTT